MSRNWKMMLCLAAGFEKARSISSVSKAEEKGQGPEEVTFRMSWGMKEGMWSSLHALNTCLTPLVTNFAC